MKISLLLIIIVFIISIVGMSGCEEIIPATGDIDKVEIIEYTVTTTWYVPRYGSYENYSKPGFYEYYPDNAYKTRYIVEGIAKNIARRNLDQILITVFFLDSNEKKLTFEKTMIENLGYNQVKDFSVVLYSTNQYFNNIENIEFHISV